MRYIPTENEIRRDLAAAYRLCSINGWDDTIYTHLSAVVPEQPGCYLINEFGMTFDEVTASSLVKVDLNGNVMDGSNRKINPTGFTIHGAVHAARSDAACVMHLHTEAGVALSMLKEGLLPLSQWSTRLFRRVGYHGYEGLALGEGEQSRLTLALSNFDMLILKNHGILTVGRTVAEAYMLAHLFERCARSQLLAMAAAAREGLTTISPSIALVSQSQWIGDGTEWDGDSEWPAMLRRLDRICPDYKS